MLDGAVIVRTRHDSSTIRTGAFMATVTDMQVPSATASPEWSWVDTLSAARPGSQYRVTSLLFSLVRKRCRDLGIAEGDTLRCLANGPGGVSLSRTDGRRLVLEREHGWFVQVEPVAAGLQ
jgi:Fe2+ transport system protein FeoA